MKTSILVILISINITSAFAAIYESDRKNRAPTSGNHESAGFYSSGCLLGALEISESGKGFQLLKPERRRNFTHPETKKLFTHVMAKHFEKHGNYYLTGDFSLSQGGPTLSGHSSHQNGLDIDIFFDSTKSVLSRNALKIHKIDSYLLNNEKINLKKWNKPLEELIVMFAKDERVDRLFIHPKFKQLFCEKRYELKLSEKDLIKIRPWYGHDEHIHVRLSCPADSPNCVKQPIPQEKETCGKDLNWWFTDDANYESSDYSKSISDIKNRYQEKMKKLPEACKALFLEKSSG